MSDEEGGKKSVGGHIAIGLAGIGALFARTADDCGRVALKGGAAVSDDAFRGASRVGSLADDGMRSGSKLGSLADDGLRNGSRVSPHGGGSLIEEISGAGAKAESHAADVAEFGVDVSLEVISNVPSSDGDGDTVDVSSVGEPATGLGQPKLDTMKLLEARSRVSQPAILPVIPATPKAFQLVLGRPEKPEEKRGFVALRPTPDEGQTILDPLKWLKGRLSHNPIALVFYTSDRTGQQNPIPLVLPNGGMTTDSIMHRACMEHFAHCIVLVCRPEKAGYKEPCAKTIADHWQTITASDADMSLQSLLEKVIVERATTVALHDVTISRVDVSEVAPRIVRSRLTTKPPRKPATERPE